MIVLNTLKFVFTHPLNRGHRGGALLRWLRWQLGSRLLAARGAAVLLPFVNEVRLLVRPGMTGATGNIYCGLQEFEDMALVLHALRPGDLFVDIGANVGTYSMLGSAAGARVLAIEPIRSTFSWLTRNIAVNGLGERALALNLGLGSADGQLRFTGGLDSLNHVLSESEEAVDVLEVNVRPLDSVLDGQSPTVMKIDVEGFESEVLAGASHALSDPELLAVVMELNGSGDRYGFDEDALHHEMLERGFGTWRYSPLERLLHPLHGARSGKGNTLYVRDLDRLTERVRSAPRFRLGTGAEI